MDTFGDFDVAIGLDVGKTGHHACALTADGEKIHDQALPHTESDLRALFDSHLKHGSVLMVVDQPNTIGALPVPSPYLPAWQRAKQPTCTPGLNSPARAPTSSPTPGARCRTLPLG